MFHHTVLMNLRDADAPFVAGTEAFAARVRAELPYVRDYHFGRNVASRAAQFGWVVIATFDDARDHERYQVSPVHQQMKAFMAPHIAEVVACDVELPARGSPR
ncbi:MAG: Dabb family protein [Burkholderiales bacterium]|nr:Dabb family protein [Burkholderiales bacterium]